MRKPNLVSSLIILNLILIASLIFLSTSQWVKAQPTQLQTTPPIISYQGFLTDDTGQPVDGTKNLVFRIYASDSDPSALWQETHTGVPVSAGDFAVLLGEFTPFGEDLFDSPDRWLEIEVEGVTLSPRQPFTNVPYALNADKLDGLDSQEVMAGQLPPGAIVWFPEDRAPEGYSPHPTALGEDVGPMEPIAVLPGNLTGEYVCKIWTGSDVLCWGSRDSQPAGIKYRYSENAWYELSDIGAPETRQNFSSIWTGTEMIVWGGYDLTGNKTNSGFRYNPSTDSWTPLTINDAPSPRVSHGAIWSGSEMIIWGGMGDSGFLGDGYRYNPTSDQWVAIDIEGAPSPRAEHVALWTGSEMIIWGGLLGEVDGALYDPLTDSWRPMSNLGGVYGYSSEEVSNVVWTGIELALTHNDHIYFYNPTTDIWRNRFCIQNDAPGILGSSISLTGNYLITQGSLFDLTQDKIVARFPEVSWSFSFWTGQEVVLLDVYKALAFPTGMRHQIELIFPYQKD